MNKTELLGALDEIKEAVPGWAYSLLRKQVEEPAEEPEMPSQQGLMVALVLPFDVAQAVAVEGGEPAESLHCTLAFLGKQPSLPADAKERVCEIVEQVAATFAPFVGLLSGAGRFADSGAEYASLDAPVLSVLREALCSALDEAGLSPKREHGFQPHITLRYDAPEGQALPMVPLRAVVFDKLFVVAGDERIGVPFTGTRVTKGLTAEESDARDAEDLEIEASRKSGEARGRHAFKKALFLDEGGNLRCVVCGEAEPESGLCPGIEAVEKSLERLLQAGQQGLSPAQARMRACFELFESGACDLKEAGVIVSRAESIAKAQSKFSHEYLDEAWRIARKLLPPWAWAAIHREAMPKAGARARSERDEQPNEIEKVALLDIRPRRLREMEDAEVRQAWLRLHQWFASAVRRKRAVENIVNAAVWVSDEMVRRGFEIERGSELVKEIQALRQRAEKSRELSVNGTPGPIPKNLEALLKNQPNEILLIRDWAVIGGSAAVTEKPNDLDVIVRMDYDEARGKFLIDGSAVQVALRRFLAPDKSKQNLSVLASPAGSFTDYVPLFDLVARRREPYVERIEPTPPAYEGQDRVVKGQAGFGEHTHKVDELGKGESGVHRHYFRLPNGNVLETEEAGHDHSLPFSGRDGSHVHKVLLPVEFAVAVGLGELTTGGSGDHSHEILGASTSLSGIHAHELMLPGGQLLFSAVAKQDARAASPSMQAQAAAARRDDMLTLGQFFFMPKPTRPTYPGQRMTVDRVVHLFEEHQAQWLPAAVQKKYDGARHQIHKDGDKVWIFSEDGDDNTVRFPGIVEAVRKLGINRAIFDTEIERWQGARHLPRETVAGYLSEGSQPDDTGFVANIYDLLWAGTKDMHQQTLADRLTRLSQIRFPQYTSGVPDTEAKLNLAPTLQVRSPKELREAIEKIRVMAGSEGVVIKQPDSAYPLDVVTPDTWIKFHNSTLVRAVVIEKHATEGGAYTYRYGVRLSPGAKVKTEKAGEYNVLPLGESFATSKLFAVGDRMLIEAETINYIEEPEEVRVTAWVPRVLGTYEGDPDRLESLLSRAKEDLVLTVKRVDEQGRTQYTSEISKRLAPEIDSFGKREPEVLFVETTPTALEVARNSPLAGGASAALALYLEPLGLTQEQAAVTYAVPALLRTTAGETRHPETAEFRAWGDWLKKEIREMAPRAVIALGRDAEAAVLAATGQVADATLASLKMTRDPDTLAGMKRKLWQLKPTLEARRANGERWSVVDVNTVVKADSEEGGEETRGERAATYWGEHWADILPKLAQGRFVYQHHYRGLTQEQADFGTDRSLMHTPGVSVHGDLRLEGRDGQLWGWAILIGKAEDNRGLPHMDKLLDYKKLKASNPNDKLEVVPKLAQPSEWLKVGTGGRPMVTGPGEVGSTSRKYSKFFALDEGTYRLGVARAHAIEVFLEGELLKGRYLFQFVPFTGEGRRWLIDAPTDQTPIADKEKVSTILRELKAKKQKTLLWTKPGAKPEWYDVATGQIQKTRLVSLQKSYDLAEKRIVYGVVLDPYVVDAHNDWMPPDEVEKTAHGWFKNWRVVGLQHAGACEAQAVESFLVEYPSKEDYEAARENKPHSVYRRKFGSDTVHSGTWILGVELTPELWEAYKRGEIAAFSVGGFGMRQDGDKKDMPKVAYIDMVELKR